MDKAATTPVLDLHNVSKDFAKPSGEPLTVLADINVSLREGEILGLLGRSGSGKSTLLRIAAGLIAPSSGDVTYRGQRLGGPTEGIAVVFQTFALFPWLTVLENVEASLDALGIDRQETQRRALAAIDLIGLDGFQSAYPRELSGGMRQRVGFARALVIDPNVLLMDEPFSALDVLTAETLRTDLLDLWTSHRLPTKAILIVTHNIEEAVLLCDRILVLSGSPGQVTAEIPVDLPQPRNRLDQEFRAIADEIYEILTSRSLAAIKAHKESHGGIIHPLPRVFTNRMSGLIERLARPPCEAGADLATLSHILNMQLDDLLPAAEALHILEFAELMGDRLSLTAAGRSFADADIEERKRLFREHLLCFVPLAAHIKHVLDERALHRAPKLRFETELEDTFTRGDAEKTLRTIIDWGRYAELFTYDDRARSFVALQG